MKEDQKTESAFSIISDSQGKTSGFQNITEESGKKDGHLDDDLSSIKGGESLDGRNKKRGMTKEELILGLKIKPA